MSNKPTFIHFTDEWGSMYANLKKIIAMWPGMEPDTTAAQTTNPNRTHIINGCLDDNLAKIGDLINIKE